MPSKLDIQSQNKPSADTAKKEIRPKSEEKKSAKKSKERLEAPSSPKKPTSPVHVVPPSPPPGKPSALALARARLEDLTAQMEFQYAKHVQISKEHDIVKAKLTVLKTLPVGIDALKEDLEKLVGETET